MIQENAAFGLPPSIFGTKIKLVDKDTFLTIDPDPRCRTIHGREMELRCRIRLAAQASGMSLRPYRENYWPY